MKRLVRVIPAVAAAVCMASCSYDTETDSVLTSGNNLVKFSVSAQGTTKGADITTGNISELTAFAFATQDGARSPYFEGIQFTREGTAFNSSAAYYWPDKATLDFFAYSPSSSAQVSAADFRTFTVTPDGTADCDAQVDLVYANTNGKSRDEAVGGSTYGVYGVPLNFRHAESKITVNARNSAQSLKFNITAFKVVYLTKSGTFTYGAAPEGKTADASTDGDGTLNSWDWTYASEPSVANFYQQTSATSAVPAGQTSPLPLTRKGADWILIPQKTGMAAFYTSEDAGAEADGSYIAVNMEIRNNDTNIDTDGKEGLLIYSGWGMWPVAFDWKPGFHYTYTVDLAGGGYYETNQDDINPGKPDLDPILDGALIRFVPVTVTPWDMQDPTDIELEEAE